jgi:CubicO group peptidase (beta-lactamase class C family)
MPRAIVLAALIGVFAVTQGAAQSSRVVRTDAEIRNILVERIDRFQQSRGIVVGLIEPEGRRIIAYGSLGSGDSRALDGDTVFEIGSITKVFTSLLLADMAERKEVELTDPVANYLPEEVSVPRRRQAQITLMDLATHTSGLPRMPSNVAAKDPFNPYADYSVRQLYEFLSRYELRRDIGTAFEYSNTGAALLGQALSRRAGLDYARLVEQRIVRPLRMDSTRVERTPELKQRLAAGHAYGLEPTPNWDLGALAAAGALHSTANDLLTFLAAGLGYTRTPLAAAMAAMLKVRRESGRGKVALAWFVDTYDGAEIVSHSGVTGGYRSFIGYDPKARIGVVVLSNSGTGAGVDDIGMHLLNPNIPLLDSASLKPQKQRREIAVAAELLDAYVGRYRFPSGQMASITQESGHLILHADGEVKVVFFAESNQDFFAKLMDAQISFDTDTQGRVTELIFHRNGSDLQVERVD